MGQIPREWGLGIGKMDEYIRVHVPQTWVLEFKSPTKHQKASDGCGCLGPWHWRPETSRPKSSLATQPGRNGELPIQWETLSEGNNGAVTEEVTPCSGLHLQGSTHSPTHTHNTRTNVHTERVHPFLRKWICYRRVHLLFFSLHTQLCTSTFLPQVNVAWGPYQKPRRCWPCVLGCLSL